MSKTITLFLLFLLYILSFSCIQSLEIDLPQSKPKLVVNAFLHPDSTIKVNLSQSLPLNATENTFPIVENAKIGFYENVSWIVS